MENRKSIPEPEMTSEGKFRCSQDDQEYDNRSDYETHCMEEHMNQQSGSEINSGSSGMESDQSSGKSNSQMENQGSSQSSDDMSDDMSGNES